MRLYPLLLITLLSITCLSCDTKKNYSLSDSEKAQLNKTIDSIYEINRLTRKSFDNTDKLYGLNRNTFMKSEDFKRQYLDSITYDLYQKSVDSLSKMMLRHDSLSTRLIIDITREYGFPSHRRLGSKISKTYLIFANAPKSYFEEIEALIQEEYEAGRMIEFKKEYILWHTGGRKTLPPMAGARGEAIWQKPLDRANK
ncbi:hypothetical protein [Lacinutrix sp. Hel_I_90]|uniref:hypothetical protein n=1 Tax=Lacinutrix sp. Hel_I_90 TaxID=1249999 RepID=UPI000A57F908|nr:hypothetical protein [Lacinutrix sp. Hel_I_90]